MKAGKYLVAGGNRTPGSKLFPCLLTLPRIGYTLMTNFIKKEYLHIMDNPTGLQENIASLLCYLFSWVSGLIFFFIDKRPAVRFNAMQSIILGVAYFIIVMILTFSVIGILIVWLLWIAFIILSIFLMIRAYQGNTWKLPLIGNLAEKWAK